MSELFPKERFMERLSPLLISETGQKVSQKLSGGMAGSIDRELRTLAKSVQDNLSDPSQELSDFSWCDWILSPHLPRPQLENQVVDLVRHSIGVREYYSLKQKHLQHLFLNFKPDEHVTLLWLDDPVNILIIAEFSREPRHSFYKPVAWLRPPWARPE